MDAGDPGPVDEAAADPPLEEPHGRRLRGVKGLMHFSWIRAKDRKNKALF